MVGIYKITNKTNGKCYIGQSVEILTRWRWHIDESKRKKSEEYNKTLYMAFRKHGIENFTFEVLELCDKELLTPKEQYWYDVLKPDYNMVRPTEKFENSQSQKVYKINIKTLKIVKIYSSVREAGRDNKVSKSAILNVCSRKRNTVNGHYFCKEKDFENFKPPVNNGNNGLRQKGVVKINPKTMEIIEEYENIREASRINNCFPSSIKWRCISKKFNSTINGGYYRFKGEYEKMKLHTKGRKKIDLVMKG